MGTINISRGRSSVASLFPLGQPHPNHSQSARKGSGTSRRRRARMAGWMASRPFFLHPSIHHPSIYPSHPSTLCPSMLSPEQATSPAFLGDGDLNPQLLCASRDFAFPATTWRGAPDQKAAVVPSFCSPLSLVPEREGDMLQQHTLLRSNN